ncbi:MAG: membrane integrity-associated transporter subunit PqiC [Gammaproteobacteria bacterium]|nr:membrane integrity-associated transporter subunit PqiC [Gammaproteobacteria bacterium]
MRSVLLIGLLTGLLTVGGCASGLLPEPAPPPATFDFGPLPDAAPAALPLRVRLEAVTAPSWLDGLDIYYRRLDEQAGALRPYARNQWIAPAPELLAQRLRHRLAQAAADAPPERTADLEIELLSFEHVFTGPDDAYVLARLRASLEGSDGGLLRREFEARRPADASVRGATQELPLAADELIRDVVGWLRAVDIDRM